MSRVRNSSQRFFDTPVSTGAGTNDITLYESPFADGSKRQEHGRLTMGVLHKSFLPTNIISEMNQIVPSENYDNTFFRVRNLLDSRRYGELNSVVPVISTADTPMTAANTQTKIDGIDVATDAPKTLLSSTPAAEKALAEGVVKTVSGNVATPTEADAVVAAVKSVANDTKEATEVAAVANNDALKSDATDKATEATSTADKAVVVAKQTIAQEPAKAAEVAAASAEAASAAATQAAVAATTAETPAEAHEAVVKAKNAEAVAQEAVEVAKKAEKEVKSDPEATSVEIAVAADAVEKAKDELKDAEGATEVAKDAEKDLIKGETFRARERFMAIPGIRASVKEHFARKEGFVGDHRKDFTLTERFLTINGYKFDTFLSVVIVVLLFLMAVHYWMTNGWEHMPFFGKPYYNGGGMFGGSKNEDEFELQDGEDLL